MDRLTELITSREFLITGSFIILAPVVFYFINKKIRSVENKILQRVTKSQENEMADVSEETEEKKPKKLTPEEIKQRTKEIMERQ